MSVNMSMVGRLTKDARVMTSNNNPETELLYMSLAVDTHGYSDKNNGGQWVQKTEYYDVQLRFKKGMADRWIKNKMFTKGHKLAVKNLAVLQREPSEFNGKHYANNLFILLPDANIYSSVEFIDYPHAVTSNGQQNAPKQTPQQSASQASQSNQGANAGDQQQSSNKQEPKVNPAEPAIDFDDDIPF